MRLAHYVCSSASSSSSSSRRLQSGGIDVATKSISKMRYLGSCNMLMAHVTVLHYIYAMTSHSPL